MSYSRDFALAVAVQLEYLLGERLMAFFVNRLQIELDTNDVWETMARRPDVFEEAVGRIFESAGPIILQVAYKGAMAEMGIDHESNSHNRMSEDAQ